MRFKLGCFPVLILCLALAPALARAAQALNKVMLTTGSFSQRETAMYVGYESLPQLYERRIYPRADGVRNVIRFLGQSNEKIPKLKAEELVDDRLVRKLEKKGRF